MRPARGEVRGTPGAQAKAWSAGLQLNWDGHRSVTRRRPDLAEDRIMIHRLLTAAVIVVAASGCAQLSGQASGNPSFQLREQAKEQARRGDLAGARATCDKFPAIRDQSDCWNFDVGRVRGMEPLSGA